MTRIRLRLRFLNSSSCSAFGAVVIAMAVAPLLGCVGDNPQCLLDGSICAGDGQWVNGSSPKSPGRELFAKLEADLVASCGGCHDAGGSADTPFLRGPDRYQSIISWPGFIVEEASNSKLVTYPVSNSSHAGTSLDADMLARVREWLEAEASLLKTQVQEALATTPRAPNDGFNAIYLDDFGEPFNSMAITFIADRLSPSMMKFSAIEVHPSAKAGVKIVHPLFVVHNVEGDPDPDPVDSFSSVDIAYPAGASGEMPPGSLLLTNWAPDAKLSIAFKAIEKNMDKPGGGAAYGCKALDAFTTAAEPLFVQYCSGCHGVSGTSANAAVDMTGLGADSAAACAQIKNRVKPVDPGQSQIFQMTDPVSGAAHEFKFNQDTEAFNSFKASVSTWIEAEQ